VFSYGVTIYEMISLLVPFEKLCKINPDININTYVTKKWRPPLPIKVSVYKINIVVDTLVLLLLRVFGLHILFKKL